MLHVPTIGKSFSLFLDNLGWLIGPSEIKVWTMQGEVVYTLSGHTSFVYSLSVLPSGEMVSGGEDRSVRVWRGVSLNCV